MNTGDVENDIKMDISFSRNAQPQLWCYPVPGSCCHVQRSDQDQLGDAQAFLKGACAFSYVAFVWDRLNYLSINVCSRIWEALICIFDTESVCQRTLVCWLLSVVSAFYVFKLLRISRDLGVAAVSVCFLCLCAASSFWGFPGIISQPSLSKRTMQLYSTVHLLSCLFLSYKLGYQQCLTESCGWVYRSCCSLLSSLCHDITRKTKRKLWCKAVKRLISIRN